jgi:hypothetical protein
MAGGRRGGRRPVPEVEVDEGRRQVPLSTFYSASQGQDEAEGSERRTRRARGPAVEPTEADDEVEEPTDGAPETEDGASGAGSSGEAATAAKVYLRGPARLPQPPLPQNRPVIRPQGRM